MEDLKVGLRTIVIAVIIGAASSYISTQSILAVMEERVSVLKDDVSSIETTLAKFSTVRTEQEKRGVWIASKDAKDKEQDSRLVRLESQLLNRR